MDFEFRMKYLFENPTNLLEQLTKAITQRSRITFSYDSGSLKARNLEPYRIVFWNGYWYLIGMDLDRSAIRLFKLSRFTGDVSISKKKKEFEISEDFEVTNHLPKMDFEIVQNAKIKIRKEAGVLLRNRGTFIADDGEFDIYQINFENEAAFLREVIWHGTNVEVMEPIELKQSLLTLLAGVLQ